MGLSSQKSLAREEQEILWSVGNGCTSKAIAERLNLSHRSVETYRYCIMKKLEIGSLARLIDFALRNGSMLRDEREAIGAKPHK